MRVFRSSPACASRTSVAVVTASISVRCLFQFGYIPLRGWQDSNLQSVCMPMPLGTSRGNDRLQIRASHSGVVAGAQSRAGEDSNLERLAAFYRVCKPGSLGTDRERILPAGRSSLSLTVDSRHNCAARASRLSIENIVHCSAAELRGRRKPPTGFEPATYELTWFVSLRRWARARQLCRESTHFSLKFKVTSSPARVAQADFFTALPLS